MGKKHHTIKSRTPAGRALSFMGGNGPIAGSVRIVIMTLLSVVIGLVGWIGQRGDAKLDRIEQSTAQTNADVMAMHEKMTALEATLELNQTRVKRIEDIVMGTQPVILIPARPLPHKPFIAPIRPARPFAAPPAERIAPTPHDKAPVPYTYEPITPTQPYVGPGRHQPTK